MHREQNLECILYLIDSPDRKKVEATADLLEYEYNRFFTFWFGAATTSVPVDDVLKNLDRIFVEFEDGRKGMATIWGVYPKQGVFCIVPFAGIWPLK